MGGSVLSTATSAAAAIVLARLLGPESYGVYALALVVPSVFLSFVGLGVNLAVTRYPAYYLSRGELEKARSITKTAIGFLALTGSVLSVVVFLVGPYIAGFALNRTGLGPYVQLAALLVLGQTLLQSCVAAFIGWHTTGLASLSSVLQAVLKLVVSVALILAGLGVSGAIVGHVFGYLFAGLVSVGVLYATKLRGSSTKPAGIIIEMKEMMMYGAPPFLGNLVSGLAGQFVTVILALIAVNAIVGYYQAAVNVTAAITITYTAVANSLFAAFSSLEGVKGDTSLAFRYAVKYVSLVSMPVVIFLIASAGVLTQVLYGSSYVAGIPYLQLLALSYAPLAIGFNVTPNFFNGIGQTKLTMLFFLIAAASLGVLAPLLGIETGLGVRGLIYAQLISNTLASVFGLYLAASRLRAKIDAWSSGATALAAVVAFGATRLVPGNVGAPAELAAYFVVFLAVYLTSVPLLRGLDHSDIVRLSIAAEGFGVLKRVVSPFLAYEAYVLRISRANQR